MNPLLGRRQEYSTVSTQYTVSVPGQEAALGPRDILGDQAETLGPADCLWGRAGTVILRSCLSSPYVIDLQSISRRRQVTVLSTP